MSLSVSVSVFSAHMSVCCTPLFCIVKNFKKKLIFSLSKAFFDPQRPKIKLLRKMFFWPFTRHEHTNKRIIFFRMTLPSVEGIIKWPVRWQCLCIFCRTIFKWSVRSAWQSVVGVAPLRHSWLPRANICFILPVLIVFLKHKRCFSSTVSTSVKSTLKSNAHRALSLQIARVYTCCTFCTQPAVQESRVYTRISKPHLTFTGMQQMFTRKWYTTVKNRWPIITGQTSIDSIHQIFCAAFW